MSEPRAVVPTVPSSAVGQLRSVPDLAGPPATVQLQDENVPPGLSIATPPSGPRRRLRIPRLPVSIIFYTVPFFSYDIV